MSQKIGYQIDLSGCLIGETVADESPLEPGVWLMPAHTVETPPPESWPEDKHPRWNGSSWDLANLPPPPPPANDNDPAAKIVAFLEENPDVAEYLAAKQRSV